MIDIAVIPVAGRGTDLLPLTKSQPKEMLPVGEKPIVQYVVDELVQNDIDRLLFVTGPGKSAIENYFDIDKNLIHFLRTKGKEDLLAKLDFERRNAAYMYTRQKRQDGLGHAVLCAEPFLRGNRFVVALGDTILGRDAPSRVVKTMVDLFERNSDSIKAVIAFDEVEPGEVVRYGIAEPGKELDGCFQLRGLIEKPDRDKAASRLAVAGRYVFAPEIFDYLRRTDRGVGDEIQLTDAIALMIEDGLNVVGVTLPPEDNRYDIGNFESYYQAFFDFATLNDRFGTQS